MHRNIDNRVHLAPVEPISNYSKNTRNEPALKIAIITNHPPPFRIPIYEKIGQMPDIDLQVIFCSRREPNREWKLPPLNFNHVFLRERFVTRGDNFIHNNFDVVSALNRFAPKVVVTTGFNPTYLYAFGYALAKGIMHVPMTDGTDVSEEGLSTPHKLIRRIVYARSHAFVAASAGGQRLYESYGISPDDCFQSCLCIDNEAYLPGSVDEEKPFDFIFCARIVEAKNPLFALRVAEEVARRLGRKIRILYVGSGPEEEAVKNEAAQHVDLVEAEFHGFAAQHELPALYRSAKIFLFPTLADVWGVVANEACAAGLPALVSPHAGVADELIVDGENGFVCPLDVNLWAERAELLLTQPAVYRRFSRHSLAQVSRYTFDTAAVGLADACRHAASCGTGMGSGAEKKKKVG
ncbi:MAG: glycosyltransferase family 4 protein [Noviherbaspirillum sp.]|nr:glycosyltransferase family 4 protein [Noviherbaspirillum sp.]